MQNNLSKEQLFDYFAGNASLLVKRTVETWLNNPAHVELYYQWLEEWERQNLHWQPDTEAAFEALRVRMAAGETPENQVFVASKNPLWQQVWWRVAAAVVLLAGSSYLFKDTLLYKTYATEYGSLQNIKLEDGTLVNLNANSTLQVPRFGFGTSTRQVTLDGEAYFSVTHTPTNQKFVVKTDRNFSVEVWGTEFSVRERARGVQVVLDKGKVKLHYGNAQPSITMKPGDLVTLDAAGKTQISQTTKPQKYSAWRKHQFVFDKTSLKEVGYLLEENFGLKVKIEAQSMAQRSISGEIEAQNADELLEALSELFGLQIRRTQNEVIFQNQ